MYQFPVLLRAMRMTKELREVAKRQVLDLLKGHPDGIETVNLYLMQWRQHPGKVSGSPGGIEKARAKLRKSRCRAVGYVGAFALRACNKMWNCYLDAEADPYPCRCKAGTCNSFVFCYLPGGYHHFGGERNRRYPLLKNSRLPKYLA